MFKTCANPSTHFLQEHPAPPRVAELLQRLQLNESHPDVRHVYNNSAFQGFAASMQSHCLDLLANMSDVSLVEQSTPITHSSISPRQPSFSYTTRPNAPWGLQRISSLSTISGNVQAMDYTYSFANPTLGAGADIYIIDTGIYTAHHVFGGRASMLWSYDGNITDLDGHGTHVSGTAAGAVLGAASNANIFGIKTLNAAGGGWSSNVIAGIDKVIQAHDARQAANASLGSVISLSLASSTPVLAINKAITAVTNAGIHTIVAAGNSNTSACLSSPASAGGTLGPAITVGAIDTSSRASFSNYGPCVDLYAPGVSVISAWIGGPDEINCLDGTSMATPHISGIVACVISENATLARNPGLMKEWVRMTALQTGGGGAEEGVLVASNGVQADSSGAGMLGFDKITGGPAAFNLATGGGRVASPVRKTKRAMSVARTAVAMV